VHVFQAGEAPLPVVADEGVVEEAPATSSGGNSPADIMVLLVFAFLIAAVGGAGAYVWHQTRTGGAQPGMARGEDPIWSGAGEGGQASLGAADEPIWSPAHSDS